MSVWYYSQNGDWSRENWKFDKSVEIMLAVMKTPCSTSKQPSQNILLPTLPVQSVTTPHFVNLIFYKRAQLFHKNALDLMGSVLKNPDVHFWSWERVFVSFYNYTTLQYKVGFDWMLGIDIVEPGEREADSFFSLGIL